jgi:4-hydroxyphenylpyruvate dioxygenase
MQAAAHGFQGIELFFDDLDCYAVRTFSGDHLEAARRVRLMCERLGLSIICLQPFSLYEGLLDRAQSDSLVTDKLPKWFQIARALGTDLIQVPSNFLGPDPQTGLPRTTGDRCVIVRDLQRLADLGAGAGFRFVYEVTMSTRGRPRGRSYVMSTDTTSVCVSTHSTSRAVSTPTLHHLPAARPTPRQI